jgi:Ca2+-binding RTX toxin-like protein
MATLHAFSSFDLREVIRAGGRWTEVEDRISIRHGDWQSHFTGDFHTVATGIVGDLLGIRQAHAGTTVFEASVDRSGFTAFDILALRDNDRFFAYVLSGADDIRGSAGDDYLIGFGGGDRMRGGGGADKLFGGEARDTIDGGSGADFLAGGDGADRLLGGTGGDTLLGGRGADVFRFENASAARSDRILDFGTGDDRIDLSAMDASVRSGHQDFDWIGRRGFSGGDGELRYTGERLSADTDGDGTADFSIRLDEDVTLTRADLIL